jgi:hypothetical protein
MIGILDMLLGKLPSTKYDIESCQRPYGYDFQGMANQRLDVGLEPIDWPTILVNQFRAEALTRPLTREEQCLYDSVLSELHKTQEVKDAQLTAKS